MAGIKRRARSPSASWSDDEESIVLKPPVSFYGASTSSARTPPRAKVLSTTPRDMYTGKRRNSAVAAHDNPARAAAAVASRSQHGARPCRSKRGVPITAPPTGPPPSKKANRDDSVPAPQRAESPLCSEAAADTSDDEPSAPVPEPQRRSTRSSQTVVARLAMRTPTKSAKRVREPSPSPVPAATVSTSPRPRSNASNTSSDDEVMDRLVALGPPARPKKLKLAPFVMHLGTGTTFTCSPTPPVSKHRPLSPVSPVKVAGAVPAEIDLTVDDDAEEHSADELDCLSQPRASTSKAHLLSRSSERARGLPPARRTIDKAPANLRIDAVGWDGRTPSDSDDSDDDEPAQVPSPLSSPLKGKGKDIARGETGGTFAAPRVQALLGSIGSVLAGHRLPSASSAGEWDRTDVMAYPYLVGYEQWERPMRYAMESVVRDGTGNCLVVLGPRGVGKTMIVEKSIALLEQVRGADSFITVRLNGLVHTTDRQALRAIARQLKSSGYTEDDGDWGSNAATMATLLRMLEPPTSLDGTREKEKPVVLIVDEFDLFALHPRQSFLYCLLDIVQGNRRKSGMGVIGLSSRTDCLSILEKRVRSRCQSQVHQMVLPNLFGDYLKRTQSLLAAHVDDVGGEDAEAAELASAWNDEVKAFVANDDVKGYLERLWRTHGSTPTHLLKALTSMFYALDWNAHHSAADWASPAPVRMALPRLDVNLLPALAGPIPREDLLSQLSVLELTVCIAAKHVRDIHDTCNLEMLYDSYKDHLRHKGGVGAKAHSKSAFAMALDALREREVFLPATGKAQHYFVPAQADAFRMLRFVPWRNALDAAVKARTDVPEPLRRWNHNAQA